MNVNSTDLFLESAENPVKYLVSIEMEYSASCGIFNFIQIQEKISSFQKI